MLQVLLTFNFLIARFIPFNLSSIYYDLLSVHSALMWGGHISFKLHSLNRGYLLYKTIH